MNDLREMIDALGPVQNVPKEKPKDEDLCKICRNPRFPYSRENGNFDLRAVEDVEIKDAKRNSPKCAACRFLCEAAKRIRGADERFILGRKSISVVKDSQEDGVQLHALLDEKEGEEYYRMFSSPRSRRG